MARTTSVDTSKKKGRAQKRLSGRSPSYRERVAAAIFNLTKHVHGKKRGEGFAHGTVFKLLTKRAEEHPGRYTSTRSLYVTQARKALTEEGVLHRPGPATGKFALTDEAREAIAKARTRTAGETTDEEEAASKYLRDRGHEASDEEEEGEPGGKRRHPQPPSTPSPPPKRRKAPAKVKTKYGSSPGRRAKVEVTVSDRSSSPIARQKRRLIEDEEEDELEEDSGNVSDLSSLADQEHDKQLVEKQKDKASEKTLMRQTKYELVHRVLTARHEQAASDQAHETEIRQLRRELQVLADDYRDKEDQLEQLQRRAEQLEAQLTGMGVKPVQAIGQGVVIEDDQAGTDHEAAEDLGGMDYIDFEVIPETQSQTQQASGSADLRASSQALAGQPPSPEKGKGKAVEDLQRDEVHEQVEQITSDAGDKGDDEGERSSAGQPDKGGQQPGPSGRLVPSRQGSVSSSSGEAAEQVQKALRPVALGSHSIDADFFTPSESLGLRTRSEEPYVEPESDEGKEQTVVPRYDDFIGRLKKAVPERNEGLRKELAKAKDELAVKRDQAQAAESRANDLEKDLAGCRDEILLLTARVDALEYERRAAETQIEALREKLLQASESSKPTSTTDEDAHELQILCQRAKRAIATSEEGETEADVAKDEQAVHTIVAELSRAVDSLVDTANAHRALEVEKAEIEIELEKLRGISTEKTKAATAMQALLESRVADLESSNANLEKHAKEVEEKMLQASETVSKTDTSIKESIARLAEAADIENDEAVEATLQRATERFGELNAMISTQENELQELRGASEAFGEEHLEATEQLARAQERIERLEQAKEAKERELADFIDKAARSLGLEEGKQNVSSILEALDDRVARISTLESELAASTQESEGRQRMIDSMTHEMHSLHHHVGHEIGHGQILTPNVYLQNVRDKFDAARAEIVRLEGELETERTETVALRERLSDTQVAYEALDRSRQIDTGRHETLLASIKEAINKDEKERQVSLTGVEAVGEQVS